MSAGGYYTLAQPYTVAIGMITTPDARGRGLENNMAKAATEAALRRGFLVIFQARIDNEASVGVACSWAPRERAGILCSVS